MGQSPLGFCGISAKNTYQVKISSKGTEPVEYIFSNYFNIKRSKRKEQIGKYLSICSKMDKKKES